MSPEEYNYAHFLLDDEEQALFTAFPQATRVGDKAADAELIDAASGEQLALSSLWKRKSVVIEFGSFT